VGQEFFIGIATDDAYSGAPPESGAEVFEVLAVKL
jgi:hypothetical protein